MLGTFYGNLLTFKTGGYESFIIVIIIIIIFSLSILSNVSVVLCRRKCHRFL